MCVCLYIVYTCGCVELPIRISKWLDISQSVLKHNRTLSLSVLEHNRTLSGQ